MFIKERESQGCQNSELIKIKKTELTTHMAVSWDDKGEVVLAAGIDIYYVL